MKDILKHVGAQVRSLRGERSQEEFAQKEGGETMTMTKKQRWQNIYTERYDTLPKWIQNKISTQEDGSIVRLTWSIRAKKIGDMVSLWCITGRRITRKELI